MPRFTAPHSDQPQRRKTKAIVGLFIFTKQAHFEILVQIVARFLLLLWIVERGECECELLKLQWRERDPAIQIHHWRKHTQVNTPLNFFWSATHTHTHEHIEWEACWLLPGISFARWPLLGSILEGSGPCTMYYLEKINHDQKPDAAPSLQSCHRA